jgi:hypothetical protein
VGTTLLALVTGVLADSTSQDVRLSHRALDDAWAREWAAQRLVVYPLALPEWTYSSGRYERGNARLLPLKRSTLVR